MKNGLTKIRYADGDALSGVEGLQVEEDLTPSRKAAKEEGLKSF